MPHRASRLSLLVLLLAAGVALACGGLFAPPDSDDVAPARGLDVGDPALDAAVDAAVREQAARDAMVEALKEGAVPSRSDEVDDAWRAVFGESPLQGRRR